MAKDKVQVHPKSNPQDRIPWPLKPEELSPRPRLFRVERLNEYEWQAYIVSGGDEHPIGKPDLFDIVKHKVAAVMKAEGQQAFLKFKRDSALKPLQQVVSEKT